VARCLLHIAVVLIATLATPALAQPICPHAESDRDDIRRTLEAAATCKIAYDIMNACRNNASGDVEFAEIVIGKCEAGFLSNMRPAVRRSYEEERQACQRRYAGSRGTMYVSFGATCEAGVAVRYAEAAARRSRGR
jgi:hypothetical protein